MPENEPQQSQAFRDAGIYILRGDGLYLAFNASDSGIKGRGSHGHNDGLSIEVSACGVAFIVDPGTYVYTANLHERHLFRSTSYHSTVQIDGVEQNTTNEDTPFVIGNEARPRVIEWKTAPSEETVTGEHFGYHRLPQPVTHRRTIIFKRPERRWEITDQLFGEGEHEVAFRFHFAPGLDVQLRPDEIVETLDKATSVRLLIVATEESGGRFANQPEFESLFSSHDYGQKATSISVCWRRRVQLPFAAHFSLIPLRAGELERDA